MTHFRSHRWAGAVLTATALFVATLAAQPNQPDPVEQAKARQKIADQKAEAAVTEAMQNADRALKNGNSAKAAQILRAALLDIDKAAAISGEARKSLTTTLQAKIAAAEGRPVAAPAPAKLDPKAAEVKALQKDKIDTYIAQLKEVNAGIERVKDAQARGDTNGANAEIAKLAAAYPNNPAVITLNQSGTIKGRLDDAIAFQKMQNDRMFAIQKGLNESSLPAIRDVEFPKNWKEISDRRLKKVEMSTKEKQIIEALDKPVSVAFNERPLEEALQDISNMLDQPLLIDKKSLEDLLIDLKKGVSLNAKGLSARTVLRSVLSASGLTFVVKDETIQIVTIDKAKTMLTTRVYYIGDIVNGTGTFGDFRWGPALNLIQSMENARGIQETIIKSIDPLSWRDNNGPGSVVFDAASMSLIVRAPTEVHLSLSKAFGPGR